MKSDMKSSLGIDKFYLECDCESPDHVWEDDIDTSL